MAQTINTLTASQPAGDPSYGGMYYNSTGVVLTVGTGGQYELMTGLSNGIIKGAPYVTGASNTLTVGASGAGVYHVCINASCASNAVDELVEMALWVNGAEETKVESKKKASRAGDEIPMSAQGFVTLAAGGYIDVRFSTTTSGKTVTVYVVNMTMTRIA